MPDKASRRSAQLAAFGSHANPENSRFSTEYAVVTSGFRNSKRKLDMQKSFTHAEELARALARYIAERPRQADSLIHWPSFAHCFEAFELASEQDVQDVLLAFEQAGWLTVDTAGHRITPQATRLAQSGQVPQLQGN
ncbi:MAG: hypothetical protein IV110_12325 [Aquabacterium sp.]|uniref:hypothetical protein n=1 Tax=Aquabacterium sp. TaxID=1872578 RepID=UPI001E14A2D9|nr:hypothetical protein [Aquabacterium sp.]MBT9610813.1 hypothetical protein [Aquabacterium sp.]